MTEFVRVSLPESGTEASVSAEYAKALKLKVLKDERAERSGRALAPTRAGGRPLKPRTTVAAKKAAANVAVGNPDAQTSSAAAGGKSGGAPASPQGAKA